MDLFCMGESQNWLWIEGRLQQFTFSKDGSCDISTLQAPAEPCLRVISLKDTIVKCTNTRSLKPAEPLTLISSYIFEESTRALFPK